ncbi:MAG: hypothetical protein U0172_15065 [Nitrospiraceae bacterium]
MLHRLTLRVLPQLTLAVTEPDIRTRKRWVMFVIGFVAFALYRLAKALVPLEHPLVLLAVAGAIGAVTAGVSYGIGRRASFTSFAGWADYETPQRWIWLLGWVGGVYGVQLALLVLALLQLCVNYDFLKHPDGPAMMAIIIPCTAVARDAIEIGHVRWLESQGRSFLTFPDGGSLWAFVAREPQAVGRWAAIGVLLCCVGVWAVKMVFPAMDATTLVLLQMAIVTLVGGTVSLCAYLDGLSRPRPWWTLWQQTSTWELLTFWFWPGLAFAATYFFVAYGVGEFVARVPRESTAVAVSIGMTVGALMGGYSHYLGARRAFEHRIAASVPATMLRCPFIAGILGGAKPTPGAVPPPFVSGEPAGLTAAPHAITLERVP